MSSLDLCEKLPSIYKRIFYVSLLEAMCRGENTAIYSVK